MKKEELLAFNLQRKAKCDTWYHQTSTSTQTQRNFRSTHVESPPTQNPILTCAQNFQKMGWEVDRSLEDWQQRMEKWKLCPIISSYSAANLFPVQSKIQGLHVIQFMVCSETYCICFFTNCMLLGNLKIRVILPLMALLTGAYIISNYIRQGAAPAKSYMT